MIKYISTQQPGGKKKKDKLSVCLLSFNFIPSMTCRIYRNHSLANDQYVKSTAVTLRASRATGTHAQCPGRLIIKTAV